MLRRRGDLRAGEYDEGRRRSWSPSGARSRSGSPGEERLIAAEDAGRYRDALGVMPPGGLPEAFLEAARTRSASSCSALPRAAARSRPPRSTSGSARARGAAARARTRRPARPRRAAAGRHRARVVRSRTCCAGSAVRRSPRCAARSSRPSRRRSAASCPPGTGSAGARPCARRSCRCRGCALPVSLWETEVLPRRVPGYQPAWLDALCASGELVWVGAGLDRVAVYFREDAPLLGRPAGAPPPEGEAARRDPRALGRERQVLGRLVDAAGLEAEAALPALWELVWAGEVTNDAWTPLRAGRRYGTPRAAAAVRAVSRARARPRSPRLRAAGRSPTVSSRARPTAVRSRSSCSSGRAS